MSSFFKNTFVTLKERKVFRTLIIYLGGAWVAIQVISLFMDRYGISQFIFDMTLILIVAGIPGSLIIAWFHGKSGAQKVTRLEIILHSVLLAFAIAAGIIAYQYTSTDREFIIEHDENTIAVLPFQNMSGDKEDEYFTDGMTDDIITQLSKIEDIQVISRFSVMKYKNTTLSLSEIAEKLNVNIILEGTVRRIGNQVRISAQLINVETEENMWAEMYDREMTEVFTVQSNVAQNIAKNLQIELSPKERQRIENQPTANLDAYDYYLKGNNYYSLYRKADNEIAIELFKKALKLDPDYANAYAGLGNAYAQGVIRYSWPDHWLDSTISMGKKAIEINPELAEGYKALALGYSYQGKNDKAIEANLKAIERNPNYFQAISNLGVLYGRIGEYDKQIPLLEKTLTLGPSFPIPYLQLGEVYASLGLDDIAFDYIGKAINMQPDFTESYYSLSSVYLRRGELIKAYDAATRGLAITPDDPGLMAKLGQIEIFREKIDNAEAYLEDVYDLNLGVYALMDPIGLSPSYLGYVYLKSNKPTVAAVVFEQIESSIIDAIESGNEYYRCKVELGRLNAIQDNKKEAFNWLSDAFDDGWYDYRMALQDPTFDNIKDDAAFIALIAKMQDKIKTMRRKVQADLVGQD